MKAYLAKKFHDDYSDRELIEGITNALKDSDIETVVMVRDFERWGEVKFTAPELMEETFRKIDECDFLIVEFSEKGVGLGIEAGYAHARGIPVFVIAQRGSEVSETMRGIAKSVSFYNEFSDIKEISEHIQSTVKAHDE